MHTLVVVFGPDVEAQMEPFREGYGEDEEERTGHWDYWRVGARWVGWLKLRPGADGMTYPLSWEWERHDKPDLTGCADVALLGDVAWEQMRDDDGNLKRPYAFVLNGEWHEKESWTGKDIVANDDYPSRWIGVLETLPRDTLVTVVDCHD